MTHEEYREAAYYWKKKDTNNVIMEKSRLLKEAEDYIKANNTCALATGTGDFVRCTPIEYSFHDGAFWMFSEGGEKFIGLKKNKNVCLAIFNQYEGFQKLHGMQVMGKAQIIEPFSDDYLKHARYKNIPVDALVKLDHIMHLICVKPIQIDFLSTDFKESGCASRQTIIC